MATDRTLPFPAELVAQIEAAARADNQTPQEWAAAAIQRQLENNRWRTLLTRNERQARALRLTEKDVPRLIGEHRRERHQSGH